MRPPAQSRDGTDAAIMRAGEFNGLAATRRGSRPVERPLRGSRRNGRVSDNHLQLDGADLDHVVDAERFFWPG